MSERMTSISLSDIDGSGIQEHGLLSVEDMIVEIRKWALRNKSIAESILEAKDEDFHIETYLGSRSRKYRRVIQEGRHK